MRLIGAAIPRHETIQILAVHSTGSSDETLEIGDDDGDDCSMERFRVQFGLEETMDDAYAVDFVSVQRRRHSYHRTRSIA